MPNKEFYWKHREELLKQEAERYRDNRDRILARNKTWNASHPEVMNKITADWSKEHPDSRIKTYKKYHKKHKKKRNAFSRMYQREHPEVFKAKSQKRRTAKTLAGGSFTAAEWKALCKRYHYKCVCCGKKKKLTADHVIPVSKGGTSNISNIQPLCKSCNSSKRDKTIDYRRGN